MSFALAMQDEELWTGEMRGVRVAGRRVLLVRLDDGVRAYEDRCAHLGVPLSEGTLEGFVLTCSAHHYQYDARTGIGINPRAARLVPLRTRIMDGEIRVELRAGSLPVVPGDQEPNDAG